MTNERTELPNERTELAEAFRRSLCRQRGFVSVETAGHLFQPAPTDDEIATAIHDALSESNGDTR